MNTEQANVMEKYALGKKIADGTYYASDQVTLKLEDGTTVNFKATPQIKNGLVVAVLNVEVTPKEG